MNRRVAILVASVALAFVVGPAMALAQEGALVADIPFKFIAAGKTHDVGTYGLRVVEDQAAVELIPPKGAGEVMLVETRLAASSPAAVEGHLVFDKVGDTYTLSEMWVPGTDGFLLHATKEKHTHHTAVLRKKTK